MNEEFVTTTNDKSVVAGLTAATEQLFLPYAALAAAVAAVRPLGVDTSYYEGKIDWQSYANAGVVFMATRATAGEVYVDPTYQFNIDGALKAGIYTSSYHYFYGNQDPVKQAQHYFDIAGDTDLPPCLDLEGSGNAGIPIAKIQSATKACISEIERLFKRRPMIYTAKYVYHDLWGDLDLSAYDLWVANYGVTSPALPTPWKTYKIWQFTDRLPVAGTTPDGNWYAGDMQSFLSWIGEDDPIKELSDKQKLDILWEDYKNRN